MASTSDLIGKTFRLTFMGSTLEITDKMSYRATFYLNAGQVFYPWVEIAKEGSVELA